VNNFCAAFLAVSVQEDYRSGYMNMFKKVYQNAKEINIKNTAHFGSSFANTKCDILVFGFKSITYDGYGLMDALTRTDRNYKN